MKAGARWARIALVALGLALPALPFALLLPQLGALQRNDYWGDFGQVVRGDHLVSRPGAWLGARSNEHRIAVPLLLWTANIRLTGGDNRGLAALSCVLLTATAALLWRLLPAALRGPPGAAAAAAFGISALVFTPLAAHNWAMGFSGNQWFLANFAAVAALVLLDRAMSTPSGWTLAALLAAVLLGPLCHSTALAIAPVVFVGALLLPVPRRFRIALGLATLAVALLALAGGSAPRPATPPRAIATAPWQFATTYLGMPFAREPRVAQVAGFLGLALFALAVGLVLRRRRELGAALAPWLLLALYTLLIAGASAVRRAPFGLTTALHSRYASLPALFWLGTLAALGLAALAWRPARPAMRRAALAAWLLFAALLLARQTAQAPERLGEQLALARQQPLATLALAWHVEDRFALRAVTPFAEEAWRLERFWHRAGHIPFAGPEPGALGESWSARRAAGELPPAGRWRAARHLDGRFLRVAGRFREPQPTTSRVVLLDPDGRLCGGGVPASPSTRGASRALVAPRSFPAWTGYLACDCAAGARAFLAADGGALSPLPAEPGLAARLATLAAACGSG